MWTGQPLVIAVEIVVWIALVSSWLSSPVAPLQRTSIHGWPEHTSTAPPSVDVPVVDKVEKLPGDCAWAGVGSQGTGARHAERASARVNFMLITCPSAA